MTEWGVVGVLIAMVGLIATLVKPMISLTKSITELTMAVRELRTGQEEQKKSSRSAHEKIWEKIDNHEGRIWKLEGR